MGHRMIAYNTAPFNVVSLRCTCVGEVHDGSREAVLGRDVAGYGPEVHALICM